MTELAKTMRIDLVPEAPTGPSEGGEKRVVVQTPTRRHPREIMMKAEMGKGSRFRELLQHICDAVLICDMSGKIVDVNVRAVEYLQFEHAELCALTCFNLIAGLDEEVLASLLDNLKSERFSIIQAYCLRKNETMFPADVIVNKIKLGEDHICFFIRDVTSRKQTEEMLRTEHTAMEILSQGVAVANVEGVIEYVNPAVALIWGFEARDEVLGMDIRALFGEDNSLAQEMVDNVIGGQQTWSGQLDGLRKDGTALTLSVASVPNRNSDGELVGMIATIQDISH